MQYKIWSTLSISAPNILIPIEYFIVSVYP